jgi:hypothetical protein
MNKRMHNNILEKRVQEIRMGDEIILKFLSFAFLGHFQKEIGPGIHSGNSPFPISTRESARRMGNLSASGGSPGYEGCLGLTGSG